MRRCIVLRMLFSGICAGYAMLCIGGGDDVARSVVAAMAALGWLVSVCLED